VPQQGGSGRGERAGRSDEEERGSKHR
jgi:hypothetical protein